MKKKYIILFLIFLFSLTNLFFANADNANIGSIGDKLGTTDWDISLNEILDNGINASIAKVSIWNAENEQKIDSFIVSDLSISDLQGVRIMSNLTKPEYAKQNYQLTDSQNAALDIEERYMYVDKIITVPNFPHLLINQDSGTKFEKVKNYFTDEENLEKLFEVFKIKDEDKQKAVLLIEPLGIFKDYSGDYEAENLEEYQATETLILLSSAELGLLSSNRHPILGKNVIDNSLVGIQPFASYYYKEMFQVMPFSCFKIYAEKLKSIKPLNNTPSNWTCTSESDFKKMVNSYGCFEVYTIDNNIATESEIKIATRSEIATKSDIEYYTNSWVITNVDISSNMGFPRQSKTPRTNKDYDAKTGCLTGKLAEITYTIESDIDEELEVKTYTQKLAIPEHGTAISWVKWKCPSEPCQVIINITTNSEDAVPSITQYIVNVVDPINGLYPPNAEATDRNDYFRAPSYATGSWNKGTTNRLSWTTYDYKWNYYWVWGCSRTKDSTGSLTEWGLTQHWDYDYICEAHECPDTPNHVCPTGMCHGVKEDWGWVSWTPITHTLTLNTSNEKLYRSANSPNTNDSDYSIKSGYGIELSIDTYCTYKENGVRKNVDTIKSAVVPPQYMEVFLPEYNFENYEITTFNNLEENGYSDDNTFNFPVNPYSQFGQKCHFTPLWYPNGKYVIGTKISQCFCPAGMLKICNNNISINIDGNAYDDWHIAPEMN